MKVKLDENMPRRIAPLLVHYGHDVATVVGEGLSGSVDEIVAEVAQREGRMLLTLDRAFADLRRYPPGQHAGITAQ